MGRADDSTTAGIISVATPTEVPLMTAVLVLTVEAVACSLPSR